MSGNATNCSVPEAVSKPATRTYAAGAPRRVAAPEASAATYPVGDSALPPGFRDQLQSIVMASAAAIQWSAQDCVDADEIAHALHLIVAAARRSQQILADAGLGGNGSPIDAPKRALG
ncbi:hypothetical protein ACG3SL_20205 [Sphingomonas sp. CJ20]